MLPLNKKFKKAHLNSVLNSKHNWKLFVVDSTITIPTPKSSNCLMQNLAQPPLGLKSRILQTEKNDTKYNVDPQTYSLTQFCQQFALLRRNSHVQIQKPNKNYLILR